MNIVILSGRLTKDPEIRYTKSNTKVGEYTLAVDRPKSSGTEQQKTDFIKCVVWKSNADFAQNWLHKGNKIIVHGRLQDNDYEDKNGNKVYSKEVVVDSHEFCESKRLDSPKSDLTPQEAATPTYTEVYGGDEELPF